MDTATSDIRAVEFTPGGDGDIGPVSATGSSEPARVLPELLDQIPEGEEIGTVTAPSHGLQANRCRATDGAYDTRRCHTAITLRQATAFGASFGPMAVSPSLPIRKNGRPWKADCPAALGMVLGPVADHASPRNETLRATRHDGRAFWKRWTGYHARSRIEAKMPSQVLSNLWRSPARPQSLRRTHRSKTPGLPNRRNPDPRRPHQPLQRTRHRRDRPHGLTSMGKGEVIPQA